MPMDKYTSSRSFILINFVILALTFILNLSPLIGVDNSISSIITVLVGLIFVLIHASLAWGLRNIFVYLVITWGLSFFSEAIGVATGYVFGHYYYTDHLGPKVLGVPLMIQATYATLGYVCLMTSRFILGLIESPQKSSLLLTTTLATLLMVGWDVCLDPYESTVFGDWIWQDGGPYFGIGIHNFVGWFITVFIFMFSYQLYATYYPERSLEKSNRSLWSQPIVYYAIMGLDIILVPLVGGVPESIASPANYSGSLDNLMYSLSLITFFVMGVPTFIALTRLFNNKP
jgi:putative membrane protein